MAGTGLAMNAGLMAILDIVAMGVWTAGYVFGSIGFPFFHAFFLGIHLFQKDIKADFSL